MWATAWSGTADSPLQKDISLLERMDGATDPAQENF
jgi:hypothetical protein